MTRREYQRAYARARRRGALLTRAAMRELRQTYIDAAALVSESVRRAELRGLSELTIQSRRAIQEQLEAGADLIRGQVGLVVPNTVRRGSTMISGIDEQYLIDAVSGQGLLDTRQPLPVDAVGIRYVFAAVNDRVVSQTINRVWQDGYTLSTRVWNTGVDYQNQINRVISAGFAQGRDPVRIARDIEVYTADGKRQLAKRYGPNLERGTKQWLRRIRQDVDYRALRLVRSELYASLQAAGRESGLSNPAGNDLYDWILEPNRQQWGCECPALADGGPYHYQDVPSYPHSNCGCRVQVQLRDGNEFQRDLERWAGGESVDYLDTWYRDIYIPAYGGG